jgi:serine/threonine protein kinase
VALLRRSKTEQSDVFPGFTDVSEIGLGSLAMVYRAREISTQRMVALKLLNVRDASARAIESFERESIALGAVSSHPNIVTLFRNFRAADGRPVLVLELCHGSIADRMHDGQGLPVPEVVSLGIKIAGALETAHRAQILHRDVKPQNILITEFGEPALADFGVAMLQSSTQTTAGLFDFTTLHAAPELLEGGETSAATDVYELASTLYQLIAGRSAFRAYEGESPASVILRILRDPVQPLVGASVPSALSDLLIYAMSKDKDERPPTAEEFAGELAEIEVAQGWPRTQFLIRDAAHPGANVALPQVRRMPGLRRDTPSPEPLPFVPGPSIMATPPAPAPAVAPVADPAPVPEAEPVLEAAPEAVSTTSEWSTPVMTTHEPAAADDVVPIDDEDLVTDEELPDAAPIPRTAPTQHVPRWTPPESVWAPPPPAWQLPAEPESANAPAQPLPGEPWRPDEPARADPQPPAAVEPVPPDADWPAPDQPAPERPPVEPPASPESPVVTPEPPASPEPPITPATRIVPRLPHLPPPAVYPAVRETAQPTRAAEEPAYPFPPAAAAAPPSAPTEPAAYPIPPAAAAPASAAAPSAGDVPVWATRTPTPSTPEPQLRKRLTLRAGLAALVADEARLGYRSWLRRKDVPWSAIRGFEPRFDKLGGGDSRGHLVAITEDGQIPLRATRRPLAELQRLHGILDAYRRRANG